MSYTYTPPTSNPYPKPPTINPIGGTTFPSDLTGAGNYPFITFQFMSYQRDSVFSGPSLIPAGSVVLPLPHKIQDQTTIVWEQASLTQMGASLAQAVVNGGLGLGALFGKIPKVVAGAIYEGQNHLSGILGSATQAGLYNYRLAINPFLVMLFKTQNFKTFNFDFVLAPNNLQDSQALDTIVKTFKNNALPVNTGLGTLGYPCVVQPLLSVNNTTLNFKPCAIESVSVDWTGGGLPAFFYTEYPAVVTLSVQLKEIELWFQGDLL